MSSAAKLQKVEVDLEAIGVPAILIDALFTSTKEFLEVQADSQMGPCIVQKSSQVSKESIEIAGVMSLSGEKLAGTMSVCFPQKTFLGIFNAMLGEEEQEINEEVADAAAEILNIIYGGVKAELNNNHGYTLKPVIPTVVRGGSLDVNQIVSGDSLTLSCECTQGKFYIELGVKDKTKGE